MSQEITKQIVNQLGGYKFVAMTGAAFFSNGNTLVTKFKGSRIANIMYITLTDLDLYDVKICKFKGVEIKEVASSENMYHDMLIPFFEKTTGLRASL